MGNIGWEWWILYAEIAVIGILLMLLFSNIFTTIDEMSRHLNSTCNHTYKANEQLENIWSATDLIYTRLDVIDDSISKTNQRLFDIARNTGSTVGELFSIDDPE